MPILGAISILILVPGILLLVIHAKVMNRRGKVDESLMEIDEILRERLQQLDDSLPQYDTLMMGETSQLIDAIPHLQQPGDSQLKLAINQYNSFVADYNMYISKFPGKLIAKMVGIGVMEGIHS